MKNPLIAALLSATVLAAMAAPSHSAPLAAEPARGAQPALEAADGSAAGNGPVRLAQAGQRGERGDGPRGEFRPQPRDGERAGPQGERAGPQRPDARADRPDRPNLPHERPRHERPGPRGFGLGLAARLAATETYLGITSAQFDAWRAYASALIDFLEPPAQRPGPRGPQREARLAPGAQGQAEPSEAAAPAPLLGERLADRAIARAEKAQALKTAIEALRPALSPAQIEKLAKAGLSFGAGPRGQEPPGPRPDADADAGPDEALPPPAQP